MKKQSRTDKDYEKLGRMLESIYESGHANRKMVYKISFLKGILGGLGGVLGATILLALLIWVLTLFKEVPLIGPLLESIRNTVETPSMQ